MQNVIYQRIKQSSLEQIFFPLGDDILSLLNDEGDNSTEIKFPKKIDAHQ